MSQGFKSWLANDLRAFLEFKHSLGYRYERAHCMLRNIDRYLVVVARRRRPPCLDQAVLTWLGRQSNRKTVTVAKELCVVRQFHAYLRRHHPGRFKHQPRWPQLPTMSNFEPWVLSRAQVRLLLMQARRLNRPAFRRDLYQMLLQVLYCTGIRLGEALRLRLKDVDMRARTLFIADSKGRSRWVPFHGSLASAIRRYLVARRAVAPTGPEDRLFVGTNGRYLRGNTASDIIRRMLRKTGLKPKSGRSGPRPYDLRHTFAVHRLTRWYRAGVDLQSRLPLLSAYMGHDDILGTETYLTATPELLALAGERLRRRLLSARSAS